MRILIFHGYLLAGTGSNVYTARLAQALVDLGHEVHLLCQDRHPQRQGFVDAVGEWDRDGCLRVSPLGEGARPARCTVYRPQIGALLPVYVQDSYEGVQALSFDRCSDAQLERYMQANVEAVREVAERAQPEIALANHLVMGPVVLARALAGAGTPYAVKVHGSALEYTVKADPRRFLAFAREGVAGAAGILVGSRHTAQSLWEALGAEWVAEHGIQARTRLGPPGVDVHAFKPPTGGAEQAAREVAGLARRLAGEAADADADAGAGNGGAAEEISRRRRGQHADAFARQEAHAAAALAQLHPLRRPVVAYVGKLIVSKGVDLLLAAWPLVLAAVPRAQLAIVGFGALQQPLEEMAAALGAGDLDALAAMARQGRALEGAPQRPLRHLLAFLDSLEGDRRRAYLRSASALAGAGTGALAAGSVASKGASEHTGADSGGSGSAPDSVLFTGRLEHDELSALLGACEAVVVPSTFPEAFGMVAVEAAACGALPIAAAHSGLAEVAAALAQELPDEVAPLLSFPVDDGAVRAIADRLTRWLALGRSTRDLARAEMVAAVRGRWSWEGVAEGAIAAAQGRVEELSGP